MKTKPKRIPLHGWINLNKPSGIGSTPALGAVKRALNPEKAGHGGTLDPLAMGILPIALGEATKTAAYAMDATKSYEFTVCWGEARSTEDAEGEVIATSDHRPSPDQIRQILVQFMGSVWQTPPRYSALKIDGARSYDLARAGHDFVPAQRLVDIHDLRLVDADTDSAAFAVDCGKGMYVRSLGRDIAEALGTVGYISRLVRTRVGPFHLADAISLDFFTGPALQQPLDVRLLPVQTVLDDISALAVSDQEAAQLRRGQAVSFIARPSLARLHAAQGAMRAPDHPLLAITYDGQAVAMVRVQGVDIKPERVFNL